MHPEDTFFKDREFSIQQFNNGEGGVIKLTIEAPEQPEEGWRYAVKGVEKNSKRGKVRGFSTRSRKNISDNMQLTDYQKLTDNDRIKPKMITLTYPKKYPDAKTAKRHFQTFFKRLKRKFPKCSGIWKLEPQKRGAPHFHFLAYKLPYLAKEEVAQMWLEIVGDEYADYSKGYKRAPMTRIETIRTHKGCACYVAKYIAKTDGSKGTHSNPQAAAGFNSLPYLTAQRFKQHFDVIEAVINRAIDEGEELPLSTDLADIKGLIKWLDTFIKKYITEEELDTLCPPIGRIWGKVNRKELNSLPKEELSFLYNRETIRALKKFCSFHRDVSFNQNNDDGGFTFYFNSQIELEVFHDVLNTMQRRAS